MISITATDGIIIVARIAGYLSKLRDDTGKIYEVFQTRNNIKFLQDMKIKDFTPITPLYTIREQKETYLKIFLNKFRERFGGCERFVFIQYSSDKKRDMTSYKLSMFFIGGKA